MDKIQSTYRFIIERNFHIFISKDGLRVSTSSQPSQPSQPCQQFPRCIELEAKTASLKKNFNDPAAKKELSLIGSARRWKFESMVGNGEGSLLKALNGYLITRQRSKCYRLAH